MAIFYKIRNNYTIFSDVIGLLIGFIILRINKIVDKTYLLFKRKIFNTEEIQYICKLDFDMIKIKISIVFLLIVISAQAQYLHEVGFFVGGSNYSGDIGRETYIYPNSFAGGVIYRRNLNNRLTLRGTMSVYPITDSDLNSSNPARQERGISFTNTISELALGVEFNYLDYDITSRSDSYTPYLFFEVAAFHYSVVSSINADNTYNYSSNVGYAIPLGIGFKSRISRRLSYSVELRTRYALADNLDFNEENIPELNIGNPKTNDWYFFTGVGLTYSFGRPPCAVQPRY